MKRILFSCFTTILFFLFTMAAHSQSNTDNPWQQTQQFFEEQHMDAKVVGGALVYIKNGAPENSSYHGFADLETNRPVDENTLFHWASITKTFTAIGIMQLRDRGYLSLDDPLTDYLPELREIHNPYGSMDELTLRMALNHSTGLRNPTWPWGGDKEWHPFEPTQWEQLVAMFPYTEVEFVPGSKHSYSNPAVIFLGKIIEQVSGDPYEVYIDKNILKPLGMNRSYFNHTPPHLLPFRSNSYQIREGTPEPRGFDFHTGITTSNGGLNAPISDMVKYLTFLLGSSADSPQILKRSSLEEMWQPELPVENGDELLSSAGLSFFLEEAGFSKIIGHTGTQHSFYSFFYIRPKTGTAVISVTNTDGHRNMFDFRDEVSREVFRNLFDLEK